MDSAGLTLYHRPPSWFHEGQLKAWRSTSTDIACIAGFQSGKTEEEVFWLVRELQRSAPFIEWLGFGRAIFAGPTMTLMLDQAIPTFRRVFEEQLDLGKYVGGAKPKFYFSKEGLAKIGTTKAITVHFAYTNDSSNLESMTACCGVWDEAGQKENKVDSLYAYNRRLNIARQTTFGKIKEWIDEDPGRQAQFAWWVETYFDAEGPDATFGRRMFGTTPYTWNWFKTQVYDRALRGEQGYELFNFPTWFNPRNDKGACFAERETMPDWQWRMFFEGIYTKPAGVVFDCFDRERCLVKRRPYPWHWQRAQGTDFGPVHVAAVWAVKDPERSTAQKSKWIVYSTYFPNKALSVDDHVSAFTGQNRCPRDPNDEEQKPIHPWVWGGAPSEDEWREQFGEAGYPISKPPISDLNAGIAALYGMIKSGELEFCDDLTFLIDDLETYAYEVDADGVPNQAKIENKEKYHRIDALRYLAVAIGEAVGIEIIRSKKNEQEESYDDREQRRRLGGGDEADVRGVHAEGEAKPPGLERRSTGRVRPGVGGKERVRARDLHHA